jgi:hypothetical protein
MNIPNGYSQRKIGTIKDGDWLWINDKWEKAAGLIGHKVHNITVIKPKKPTIMSPYPDDEE